MTLAEWAEDDAEYRDPMGVQELLAPGVVGYTWEMPDGSLNIPLITALRPGSGDVGRYLDGLPHGRHIRVPCVISARLQGMLERRGFTPAQVWSEDFEEWVDVMERRPL
jgi:hypothetical protein